MTTKSTMVTSNWGDEHMFFRHQRMEADLNLRPEWEQYVPNSKILFANPEHEERLGQVVKYACPFLGFFM